MKNKFFEDIKEGLQEILQIKQSKKAAKLAKLASELEQIAKNNPDNIILPKKFHNLTLSDLKEVVKLAKLELTVRKTQSS